VQALLADRWPRLFRHLRQICARADLADVDRRRNIGQTPSLVLQQVVEEEWIVHAFAGSFPEDTLLWAFDQFCLQGWSIAAEMAAASFWLIRIAVRQLDRANGGATELRYIMRSHLRKEASIHQLQALVAQKTQECLERAIRDSGSGMALPQAMIRMPIRPQTAVPAVEEPEEEVPATVQAQLASSADENPLASPRSMA
jgi:hypothetical protein